MFNYNIYMKIYIEDHDTTAGMNFDVKGNSSFEAAKIAKEINKDKNIIYIEVSNVEGSEPITFFDGKTLKVFYEL